MSVESCEYANLDEDIKQQLLGRLGILQNEYIKEKTNAIEKAYDRQKERDGLASTCLGKVEEPAIGSHEPASRRTMQRKPSSPVLYKKSKKRKLTRKFFPHFPATRLQLFTKKQAVQEFSLPAHYVVTINHDAYVAKNSTKSLEDNPINSEDGSNSSEEGLFQYLNNVSQKKNNKVSKLSLFHQSSAYLAFVLDDINIKVYEEQENKWKELFNIASEEPVVDLDWMVATSGSNIYLLSSRPSMLSLSQYNVSTGKGFDECCEMVVRDLSCVAVIPGMKIVVCGEKMQKYAFNQSTQNFQELLSFVLPESDVITLSRVDHQPQALLGCSSSHFYLWSLATGSLLRQLKAQPPNLVNLLTVTSLKGALAVHLLVEVDDRLSHSYVIINPTNRKLIAIPEKMEANCAVM